jgi:hypothetical protein
MIDSVHVIGARGRVGGAVSARLAEQGVELGESPAALTSSSSACPTAPSPRWPPRSSPARGWPTRAVARLSARSTRTRSFAHSLQTFTHDRGRSSWTAPGPVTGETADALEHASALARCSAPPVPRGRPARALPRGRRNRLELPRHPASRRRRAARRRGRARRRSTAHAPRDRQRVPLTGPIERGTGRRSSSTAPRSPRPRPTSSAYELARLTASNRLLHGAAVTVAHRGGGRAALSDRRDGTVGIVPTWARSMRDTSRSGRRRNPATPS